MHLIAAQLQNVSPNDGLTFASVVVLLGAICGVAAVAPALRAARIDPLVALQSE
jgi:ABC-type antimicrobial peptide transport system permease subunit